MPLVFVHGVATRQTPAYLAEVAQRDQLFRSLVLLNAIEDIEDPDWGSEAVKLSPGAPWLPKPGATQAFAVGGPLAPAGPSLAAALTSDHLPKLSILPSPPCCRPRRRKPWRLAIQPMRG